MSNLLIVILLSVGAVALFGLAMSLTLIIKGRYMDSEISTNKNMQRLGIKCAVHQAREDNGLADCSDVGVGCSGSCSACDIEAEQSK